MILIGRLGRVLVSDGFGNKERINQVGSIFYPGKTVPIQAGNGGVE
jgi:hypothetical protein